MCGKGHESRAKVNYIFEQSSQDGLLEALTYYAIIFDTDDATKFRTEIHEKLTHRLRNPKISPEVYEDEVKGHRYRQVLIGKFYFFYRIVDSDILIDEIAHEASQIPRFTDL